MARRASSIATSATKQAIYRFVRDYIADKGFSPSLREIGAGVGLSSLSSVHRQVKDLAAQGVLIVTPHLNRTIILNQEVKL